jgi:hypothetical protein
LKKTTADSFIACSWAETILVACLHLPMYPRMYANRWINTQTHYMLNKKKYQNAE